MTMFNPVQTSIYDAPAVAKTPVAPSPSYSSTVRANAQKNVDTAQFAPALRAVYEAMRHGRWMSLADISFASGYPEASVSARIRDLHNQKGLAYQKRKAKAGKVYSYRLVP